VLTETVNAKTLIIPGNILELREADFDLKLDALMQGSPSLVIIDCSQINQVTSTHIQYFWSIHLCCKKRAISLHLKYPSKNLLRVLDILDIAEFFPHGEVDKEYNDKILLTYESVQFALGRFSNYMEYIQVPRPVDFELKTIFYEIATNIRLHSGLTGDDSIEFFACMDSSRMLLTFKDSGIPFDMTSHTSVDNLREIANRKQKRGLGITMIKRIADNISYERTRDERNILTIEKYLGK